MNRLLVILCFGWFLISCSKKIETNFNEKALGELLITQEGNKVSLKEVIEKHKEKKLVIEIWASWCKDCLKSIPKNKEIQNRYTKYTYIHISIDRTVTQWKNAVKQLKIEGEHYFMPSGWDGSLGEFLQLDWIPRYLIVGEQGKILTFNCEKLQENVLDDTLKK